MSNDIVQGQYDQLETLVSRFTQLAETTTQMQSQLRSGKEALEGGGWIGRGLDAFSAEMNGEIMPAVQRMIEAMNAGSQVTAQLSSMLRQAEEEAAAIYKNGDGFGGGAGGGAGGGGPAGGGGGFQIPGILKDIGSLAWNARKAFKDITTPGKSLSAKPTKGGVLFNVAMAGYDNWKQYKDSDYAAVRIATGTAVDAAVKTGLQTAGRYAGQAAGTALGAAVGGPVGAVIGGAIGNVVGGFIGGKVADLVIDSKPYKAVKGVIVDGAAGLAKGAGKVLKSINPFD